jgi:integrase
LNDTGRLEILQAIAANQLSIAQAYAAHCAGQLTYSPSDVVLDRPLWDAVRAWLPGSARAAGTRTHYEKALRALERHGDLRPGLTVRGLELADWTAIYNRWPTGPAGWNRMRGALSRFLTMALGDRYHPFRRRVMAKMPHAEESDGVVPDLSVERFWQILGHVREALQPIYVTMVATGIGPGEIVRSEETDLLPHSLSLRVHGTKEGRKGAQTIPLSPELWEWARRAIPCPVRQQVLYRHWKRACKAAGSPALRLYDLRHAYGQWLVDAGVPEARVQVGMRHKTAGMTRRYTKQRDRGSNAQAMTTILFGEPETPAKTPARRGRFRVQKGA